MKNSKSVLPRVSICTPTFNRRPFFKGIIESILSQDYPHNLLEWVIVDDGMDKIGDLVKDIPFVKYFPMEEKMPLGKKRNYMHDMCSFKEDSAIIVYMDDDDFYPVNRVSHAVNKLINSKALCAGSSELYIWFNTLNKMYRFGPYGPNHATAGTFAFKRALLKQTRYEDNAVLAEEKFFLKDYTIPFVQLEPLKTILVFSHEQNTFDKRKLIDENNKMCHESALKVKNFIKSPSLQQFYMKEIDILLKSYELGELKYKPDVIVETKRRDIERAQHAQPTISIKNPDGTTRVLNQHEIIHALKLKIDETDHLNKELESKQAQINKLMAVINEKNLQSFFN
jgi:glycosyltransferase involved in cell wall biosynthesis